MYLVLHLLLLLSTVGWAQTQVFHYHAQVEPREYATQKSMGRYSVTVFLFQPRADTLAVRHNDGIRRTGVHGEPTHFECFARLRIELGSLRVIVRNAEKLLLDHSTPIWGIWDQSHRIPGPNANCQPPRPNQDRLQLVIRTDELPTVVLPIKPRDNYERVELDVRPFYRPETWVRLARVGNHYQLTEQDLSSLMTGERDHWARLHKRAYGNLHFHATQVRRRPKLGVATEDSGWIALARQTKK